MAWARARSTGRQGSPSRSASGRHAPWGLWKCAAPELCPADGTSPAPTYSRPCGLAGGRRGCGKNRNELKKRSSVSTHGLRKNSQSRKLHLVTREGVLSRVAALPDVRLRAKSAFAISYRYATNGILSYFNRIALALRAQRTTADALMHYSCMRHVHARCIQFVNATLLSSSQHCPECRRCARQLASASRSRPA